MSWFKKKQTESVTNLNSSSETSDNESEEKMTEVNGNIEVELTKIKSSLEALNEVRKANAEQFTRTSEQIGELRGALMDTNKAVGAIEVASTKAIDMVTTVQPDKLMVEVRKIDGKVEALRANIEANETIMRDIMREMKEIRGQMNFYKGVDQVVKMNNEIKQELIDIKKTEGIIGKHADRVETIFVEVEKKFYDFEKFNEAVKELDRAFKKIGSDFDKMRVNVDEKADKKEFVKMVDKFTDFEKHTSNILKLLDQKSRTTIVDLNSLFTDLKKQLEKKYDKKIDVKGLNVDDKPLDSKVTSSASDSIASTNTNIATSSSTSSVSASVNTVDKVEEKK
jgi:hypothetical protein